MGCCNEVVERLKSNVIFKRSDNVIGTNQLKNHNVFSTLLDKTEVIWTQQAIFHVWRRITWIWGWNHVATSSNLNTMSHLRRITDVVLTKKKRHHYIVVSTSCLKRCWHQVEIALQLRWNYVEIMTLKQISYETFSQRRFNVSLLFFNVVSTLKQRRCACWEGYTKVWETL